MEKNRHNKVQKRLANQFGLGSCTVPFYSKTGAETQKWRKDKHTDTQFFFFYNIIIILKQVLKLTRGKWTNIQKAF